jgi:hypothetical protein
MHIISPNAGNDEDLTSAAGGAPQPPEAERSAPERSAPSADAALAALPDDLRGRLGRLAGAPDAAVELAIGLLPYGYRALLVSYGLVEIVAPDDERSALPSEEDPRRRVRVLELGEKIIEACADPPEPLGAIDEVVDQAAELRNRYGPEPPFEAEKAD